ncbi:DoxX family protein [Streptomyces sp. SID3343]|uniref:DoxX family protein n=1 Tax=Streptomyces sp. SID3343 TaxID=2690260 RepID=UPI00136E3BD5|nr:DoxX family protein [Streptomyces sp. SID3343]MYW00507.1 DoxX family membrane protein [Streptomyces sp. SID3343]
MSSPIETINPSRTASPAPDAPTASPHGYDVGLLLLRVAVGVIMVAHGTQKLFGWFGSGGLDGTGQFFTMSGYPAGKTMAAVAGVTETFGGLALVVGLCTPLAAAAIVGTMLNATAVKWDGSFYAPTGVEYELLLTAGAAALALTGPGRYAADRLLPVLRAHRLAYGAAALVLAAVSAGVILLIRD